MKKESKGTVLVVDDNQDVLNAIEILAEDEFDQIITLTNPDKLLHYLKT